MQRVLCYIRAMIYGPEQVGDVARELRSRATVFQTTHPHSATLITISGDLGAGKTTLVQSLAHELGVTEPVQSPTYVLMKRYALSGSEWKILIHIDAYRMEDPSELVRLGWEELLNESDTLVVLEWPEMVESVLPLEYMRTRIEHKGNMREIIF